MKKEKVPANEMIAGDVFLPGEYIVDEMEARGMKQVQLAEKLGLSKSEVNLIIHGKRGITVPIAIKLERIFDIDAEYWMSLQIKYEIEILKKKHQEQLKKAPLKGTRRDKMNRLIARA
ncbi:MAG: HigA family addiction module antidote protein [Bacteroidia bacterium]|nr:HigA family addiction module antidote protein [Bacteroidia bacterium]